MIDLLVLNGSRAGTSFALPDVPTVLGRSPEAHLRIDDPWISNMHALFEPRGKEVWVVDLGSRNGTFVGPERVEEAQATVGAVLAFGRTEVRVEPRGAAAQRGEDATKTPVHFVPVATTVRTARPMPELATEPRPHGDADPFRFTLRPLALVRFSLALAPGAAPPDAATLRAALDRATAVVRRHGGRTTRLGSAAALAVFGFGGPDPDDALRALRAAEAVRAELRAHSPALAPRLVVDAGPALAGLVSGHEAAEFVVLGEAPDRAELLVALARPGELLVGPGVSIGVDPRLVPATDRVVHELPGLRRLPG